MGGIGGGGAATELGEGGTPLEAVVVDLVVECQGLADDDMEERNSALTPNRETANSSWLYMLRLLSTCKSK